MRSPHGRAKSGTDESVWYQGAFAVQPRADGLTDLTPEKVDAELGKGLIRPTTGAVPVAWINSEARLSAIVEAASRLFETGGTDPRLAEICREAHIEVWG